MRQIILITFFFMSSSLHAAIIRNDQQLMTEVQKVTEERNNTQSSQAFQELMKSLLESKHNIADLPEDEYQQHMDIYLKVIELREYLGNIKLDAQGNCVQNSTRQVLTQSPMLQQELQASSVRGIFSQIYNRLCR